MLRNKIAFFNRLTIVQEILYLLQQKGKKNGRDIDRIS